MIPGDGGATGATEEKADAICCRFNRQEQTKRKRGISLRDETIVPDSNSREPAFCVDVVDVLLERQAEILLFLGESRTSQLPCRHFVTVRSPNVEKPLLGYRYLRTNLYPRKLVSYVRGKHVSGGKSTGPTFSFLKLGHCTSLSFTF